MYGIYGNMDPMGNGYVNVYQRLSSEKQFLQLRELPGSHADCTSIGSKEKYLLALAMDTFFFAGLKGVAAWNLDWNIDQMCLNNML